MFGNNAWRFVGVVPGEVPSSRLRCRSAQTLDDMQDCAGLMEQARREGWNLVALDLGIDLSTPAGEFLANVMASAAQWERRIIGQRTREALDAKKASGARLGRPVTLPAKVRRRIARERQNGKTLAAIAEGLNRDQVPTAHDGSRWHPETVRAALRSVALDAKVS